MLTWIQSVDDAVIRAFDSLHTPVLTAVLSALTWLGNHGILWIILGLVLLIPRKTRKTGCTVLIALLLGFVVCNLIVKPTVARVRPYDAMDVALLIAPPTDFSFPSGHTAAAFEAAVAAMLCNRKIGACILPVAILMAFSRIYFQVHYLSDVLAGALVGTAMAVVAYYMVKAVSKRYEH